MPLEAAQTFFHKQGVSSVATIKLKKGKEDAAAFERAVKANSPTSSLSKTRNSIGLIRNSRF